MLRHLVLLAIPVVLSACVTTTTYVGPVQPDENTLKFPFKEKPGIVYKGELVEPGKRLSIRIVPVNLSAPYALTGYVGKSVEMKRAITRGVFVGDLAVPVNAKKAEWCTFAVELPIAAFDAQMVQP